MPFVNEQELVETIEYSELIADKMSDENIDLMFNMNNLYHSVDDSLWYDADQIAEGKKLPQDFKMYIHKVRKDGKNYTVISKKDNVEWK